MILFKTDAMIEPEEFFKSAPRDENYREVKVL
jgi:hypothetical protein